ncbi:MAG: geranylgeranyl reductase, partial [Cyanobium sp.]
YGATYKVLEILQNIFYSNDAAREAFVEMCDDKDVQRLTFDSYLYKRVVAMNPWQQLKLTFKTLGSVLRGQALAPSDYRPVPSAVRSEEETQRMLAVSTINGGIRMPSAAAEQGPAVAVSANGPVVADAGGREQREPALAGK